MVTTFYPPRSFGGDAVAVQSLARALVRAGHHVTVVCDDDAYRALSGNNAPIPPETDDGVAVKRTQRVHHRSAASTTVRTEPVEVPGSPRGFDKLSPNGVSSAT